MYLWFITFAILQVQYYVCAHRDEGGNIEKLVYLLDGQGSHGERGGSDTRDIEASRRSVTDKNFMRFGRSKPSQPDETYDDFDENLIKRSAHDNFMRYGRQPASSTNFMRYGRGGGNDQTNFMRYGKRNHHDYAQDYDEEIQDFDDYLKSTKAGIRFKRSTTEATDDDKRASNQNFLRFGRNSNFMRFGRQDFSKCSLYNIQACLQQQKYPQFPLWLGSNQLLQQQPPMQNFDEKHNNKKI
ncbi:FMRFamide-related peptides, partial [Chrysoperla carnea]|uniref:FMRFamide-related peptides n=1 Tax=Chrysoperla carnea TaxID=189513 RepID=UPI001D07234E